jgi:hypothetical protein
MNTWADTLHLTNRVLEAAPLLSFIAGYLRRINLPPPYRLMYYYVGAKSLFYMLDVVSRSVFRNNVYLFHLSTIVTVLLLSRVYYRLIDLVATKKLLPPAICVFMLVAVADALFLNKLFIDINSYSQACGSTILITLSLLHILQLSRREQLLDQQPEFFFSIAVLVYSSYSVVTYVASNIIYNAGYGKATNIRLDTLISAPDALLYAVHMGLLAWMFSFFPLSINPRQALPYWLHYSRWRQRSYKLLGNNILPGIYS